MKRKHLYVILAILAVGLLLYAPSLVRRPGEGGASGSGDAFSLEGLDAGAVSRIRITTAAGETALLERTDRGWRVDGHRADSATVADLVAALDTMRTTQVVARNPGNHARLEVTSETGRTVELGTPAGDSFTFVVGSRDLGTEGYHVRRAGEDRVWLLRGPVGAYLRGALDYWRDRVLAGVDTSAVREVLIRREGEELVLRRADGEWSLGDGTPADSAAVSGLLRRLPRLLASDFPPDSVAAAADFGEPDAVLNVFARGEGEDVTDRELVLSLRFLRGEDGEPWLVRRADETEVYELSAAVGEALVPDREKLAGEDSPEG